jgi:hypothetical protein
MQHSTFLCDASAWASLLVLLVTLAAGAADAQNSHYLLARAGNQFQSESTFDPNDDHVEKLFQLGVGGVNPSFFSHLASTDSASGVMTLSSGFSSLGGAGDPIQPSPDPRSVALIEQAIDPGATTAEDVTVTATLVWDGAGSLTSGSGDVDGGFVAALLDIDGCRVYLERRFYSNGTSSDDAPVDSCTSPTGSVSGGPGALSVTVTRPAASISSGTRFYLETQLEAEANFLEYFDSGQWSASAALSVEVTGAAYSFESPTFLTVPEPAALAAELTAVGVLGIRRRRRRAAAMS